MLWVVAVVVALADLFLSKINVQDTIRVIDLLPHTIKNHNINVVKKIMRGMIRIYFCLLKVKVIFLIN